MQRVDDHLRRVCTRLIRGRRHTWHGSSVGAFDITQIANNKHFGVVRAPTESGSTFTRPARSTGARQVAHQETTQRSPPPTPQSRHESVCRPSHTAPVFNFRYRNDPNRTSSAKSFECALRAWSRRDGSGKCREECAARLRSVMTTRASRGSL